jgi:hypothetical protein
VSEPLLTIGWSVLGSRLAGLRLPPPRPDVELLVVVQDGPAGPSADRRPDVRYVDLAGRGVSRSRNAVLDHARGTFVLFGDDDIVFDEAGVRRVLEELQRDDGLALALAAAVDEHGQLRKRYPRRGTRLHRWNSGKAATYEMIVRRAALSTAGVRFDEEFGAGAEQYLGDEYILIADAVRRGLRCRFFPHVVAMHPRTSSGSGFGTARDAAARAAVFGRVFGRAAPVARLAFLIRAPRRFGSVRVAAGFVRGKPAPGGRG